MEYLLILVMTFGGALASIYLKKASSFKSIKELLMNKNLYIGGLIYVICAIINIIVLKTLDYSLVLPLTSITYIWTMILAYTLLKEKISRKRIIGLLVIIMGVIILVI